MDSIIAAAISTRNIIGRPEIPLQVMELWLQQAAERGAELYLFPELNVSGYIPAPIASQISEPGPGPSNVGITICRDVFFQ